MKKLKLEAHGKINWTLSVLGKRRDGYHELRSIVLPIGLHDEVEIVLREDREDMRIEGCVGIPDAENLAGIAATRLLNSVGRDPRGIAIRITKRIPAGAGLGGGSADAAAVLRGLNQLLELQLAESRLVEIAATIGSDVPALVLSAPVMMEGRGENVRRLSAAELREVPTAAAIEIMTPPIFASTAAVYGEFREDDRGQGRNDLQPAALRLYPKIGEALAEMRKRGLKFVAMSGSGSTVYGVRP